jgi:hypothetical protein
MTTKTDLTDQEKIDLLRKALNHAYEMSYRGIEPDFGLMRNALDETAPEEFEDIQDLLDNDEEDVCDFCGEKCWLGQGCDASMNQGVYYATF